MRRRLLLALPLLLAAGPAPPRVEGGWVRRPPPGAPAAAGYLVIANPGPGPDRLVSVSSPDAARVELHRMDMAGGVMRMRPVEGGLELPAAGRIALAPGGTHLMLIGPKRALRTGDRVTVDLDFARAGRARARLPVRATPPAGAGGAGR